MNKKLLFIFFLSYYFNMFSMQNFSDYVLGNKKTVMTASLLWYIVQFVKKSAQKLHKNKKNYHLIIAL
jgi:hypothetical protein